MLRIPEDRLGRGFAKGGFGVRVVCGLVGYGERRVITGVIFPWFVVLMLRKLSARKDLSSEGVDVTSSNRASACGQNWLLFVGTC